MAIRKKRSRQVRERRAVKGKGAAMEEASERARGVSQRASSSPHYIHIYGHASANQTSTRVFTPYFFFSSHSHQYHARTSGATNPPQHRFTQPNTASHNEHNPSSTPAHPRNANQLQHRIIPLQPMPHAINCSCLTHRNCSQPALPRFLKTPTRNSPQQAPRNSPSRR